GALPVGPSCWSCPATRSTPSRPPAPSRCRHDASRTSTRAHRRVHENSPAPYHVAPGGQGRGCRRGRCLDQGSRAHCRSSFLLPRPVTAPPITDPPSLFPFPLPPLP